MRFSPSPTETTDPADGPRLASGARRAPQIAPISSTRKPASPPQIPPGIGLDSLPDWLQGMMDSLGPSLGSQMMAQTEMQRARFERGERGPAPPGSPEAEAGLDVAGAFDFTGSVGKAGIGLGRRDITKSMLDAADKLPTRWYHGGAEAFDAFDENAPHMFESVAHPEKGDIPVFWAADNSSTAYDYAASAGAKGRNANINEFDIAPSNPKVVDVQGELQRLADELGVDLPEQGTAEATALLGDRYKYDVIEQALADGHDAVVFKNFADTPNYYGQSLPTILAFIDPALAKAVKGK